MDTVRKLKQQGLFMSLKRDLAMEVFVAEEWVKEAYNDVRNEVHLCLKTKKALGATREENTELLTKLTTEKRERKRVLADSPWRQLGSIYYHPDIREVPSVIPSPLALTPETFEQPLTIQTAFPLPEASKGSNQASDQGQKAEGAKDRGKGKENKPSLESKDAAKAKEAAAKEKEAETKTKEIDPKAKDAAAKKAEGAKDKGKGKENKPSLESKDAARAKEAAAKAKEAEAKTKEIDPKVKDAAAKAKEVEIKTKEADPKAKDAPTS
nr:uncharacterized protein LOC112025640 [Quercus suber]